MQCTLDLCCPYLVNLHPVYPTLSYDPPPHTHTLCALSPTIAKFQLVFPIYDLIIFIIYLLINQNGRPQGGGGKNRRSSSPLENHKEFLHSGGGGLFSSDEKSFSPCEGGGLFFSIGGALFASLLCFFSSCGA